MKAINRNLDGIYFRIKRNDKWDNICFSDLTESEMESVMADRDEKWLRSMCKMLGNTIRKIGNEMDLICE